MKEKKLKVFALPIEEFEEKYPVLFHSCTWYPKGTCCKGGFCTPLLDFYNSEG